MIKFSKILEAADLSQYADLVSNIEKKIEDSLKTSDSKTIEAFMTAFIKDKEKTKIEGLINDADIYEFYLNWRNDIDAILLDEKFYDEVPSEKECFSLYDYVVKGTMVAVYSIVKQLANQQAAPQTTEEQKV